MSNSKTICVFGDSIFGEQMIIKRVVGLIDYGYILIMI